MWASGPTDAGRPLRLTNDDGDSLAGPVTEEAGLLYELRIYECFGGRLPALNKRFNDHTTAIFERHGIKNIGYWTTEVGPSSTELTYMIAFEDAGQRERAWESFRNDPEWNKVRAASEEDGLIVKNVRNLLLKPTPYSPLQ